MAMWLKLKSKKFYIPAVAIIVILVAIFLGCRFHNRDNCSSIAVIPITGQIVSSPQYNDDGSVDKSYAVAIDIIAKIRKAEKDKKIKALFFVIDSNGGDAESGFEVAKL